MPDCVLGSPWEAYELSQGNASPETTIAQATLAPLFNINMHTNEDCMHIAIIGSMKTKYKFVLFERFGVL